MRLILFAIVIAISSQASAQDKRISTIDFVQVLNENKAETLFYYENNWKQLRIKAIAKGYIDSYQLLETSYSSEWPFQFMLITTYGDKEQYEKREDNFGELIEQRGDRKLLNAKQPGEFRKILFSKDVVAHL